MAMLHCFAAAARCGTFSRAAGEIGLTQSAVSRQVAALEEWLGRPLFERKGRRVTLNDAGRAFAEAIEPALSGIRQATRRAIEQGRDHVIDMATLPSFGMRWLAPRLPRLSARHPELVVNFTARSDEFSFAEESFDAAIHFGKPDWPGARHDLLFREAALPVVAASLADRIQCAADFRRLPLLVQGTRREAWRDWFALARVDAPVPPPSGSFTQFLMLAQAAAAGAGAALIPRFLIEPELEAGTLVAPIPLELESDGAYYLVYPETAMERNDFASLRGWLLGEAKGDPETETGPATSE
jgi:LysR family glycine cleavage system transcriptional activator